MFTRRGESGNRCGKFGMRCCRGKEKNWRPGKKVGVEGKVGVVILRAGGEGGVGSIGIATAREKECSEGCSKEVGIF